MTSRTRCGYVREDLAHRIEEVVVDGVAYLRVLQSPRRPSARGGISGKSEFFWREGPLRAILEDDLWSCSEWRIKVSLDLLAPPGPGT